MKKLVTSGFKGKVLCRIAAFAVCTALTITVSHAQQGCVLTCPLTPPPVEISLSAACQDTITWETLGVTATGCQDSIIVDIIDNGMSLGNVITEDMIGNTYMVIVSNPASGNSCMTEISVVESQAPILTCPDDITLECNADLSAYNGLSPGDIQDCSGTEVFIEDDLQFSGMCDSMFISQYLRTYTVIDEYGNAASCQQIISLVKANLSDVVFPPDLTGNNALSCFPLPDTSPEGTGYPAINGDPILNGLFCNLTAIYTDIEVPLCSGSYKILRTWIVMDWCEGILGDTVLQTIEVKDQTAPVVMAPDDITVSTNSTTCLANVVVGEAIVSEDCSSIWTVRMEGPFGNIPSNGGLISGLPVGVHSIVFIATNDCDLTGMDTMLITVQDLQPPVPVCHQDLAIPVNLDGFAIIPAYIFNGASYDNCGDVYFKVKRMSLPLGYTCANPGNPLNQFDDYVQFCCEDIAHNNIMVILRVYDTPPVPGPVPDDYLAGHFNDCMMEVEVQDKLPPQIICPSDLTISCEFPFTENNLGVFGVIALSEAEREQICLDDPGVPGDPGLQCLGLDGLATDNCHLEVEELPAQININNCGVGTIIRTFRATDDGGLQAMCQQTITVINYDLFSLSDITWPLDYTTTDVCDIELLDPEDLDPPYNQPSLNGGPCDLVGATYEDEIFNFSNPDQACFKILRTWKVVDWCQLNTPTYGQWSHIQVIKVMNTTDPVIAPIADLDECSFDPECGGLVIDFEAVAQDDCSGPESLIWRYFVDEGNNNSFEDISGNIPGDTLSFSRYMPIGEHRILYTVWDKCGNSSTREQFVNITSCKAPSAKCIHGLSTNLMAMDTDGDGIPDWGMVTLQAEMFDAGSDHPCGIPISLAFSSDPTDVTRIFDCTDLGINEIELWAIDENGLTDFCITTIEIQDNNGICPPQGGTTGIIAGTITVPQAGALSGAMIHLEGSQLAGIPTSSDGHFVFPLMPLGGSYVVRPEREGDDRNGVTTLDLVKMQKHLLGLETFATPFQYIAADVNNSASITAIDIIQLRKLILGYYPELPNNKSWRFVDKAHIFPDPQNPWVSPWPETYSIIPFNSSMNDVDFHAIKIGDLNLSANLHAHSGILHPRGDQKCTIEYLVASQPEPGVYKVDLYVDEAQLYQALQFSFTWDQSGYKVLDWHPGASLTHDDIRMPEHPGENASIAVISTDGWAQGKLHLMTLWVEQVQRLGRPFKMYLNTAPTPALAYTSGQEEPVAVQFAAQHIQTPAIYNRPNPFKDFTTIHMVSDREEEAVLRVYDLGGKQVIHRKVRLIKGENEYIVSKTDIKDPGIYLYEIESEYQYSTNRMIIVD